MSDGWRETMQPSAEILLRSMVDYAGTFPPASLRLMDAVANYARYRSGSDAWMLGRFVLPATSLEAIGELSPPIGDGPWDVTVVLSQAAMTETGELAHAADRSRGRLRIVSVEVPPLDPEEIGALARRLPAGLEVFFEVRLDSRLNARLAAIAAEGALSKVRTGGVTADAFPAAPDLLRFLRAAVTAGIAVKATAGLHHALKGWYPATDDPGALLAPMHGFLNVFAASALASAGDDDGALEVLEESSSEAFRFLPEGLAWRQRTIRLPELSAARRFFRSFGSCDFQTPVEEVKRLLVSDER